MTFLEYYLKEETTGITVGHKTEHNTLPDLDTVIEYVAYEDDESDYDADNYHRRVAGEILDHLGGIYNHGENIPVYRCVNAEDVDLDEWAIGESWSAYLDSAKEFGSRELGVPLNKLKIISGLVPRGNVNWDESANRYVQFSGSGNDDSEFELVIPSGNIILDVKVEPYKTAVER